MGLLIPEDIPLDKLPPSERRVIRRFQSTPTATWLIIPRVDLLDDQRPSEIDALSPNALQGIAATEPQGGRLPLRTRA